MDKCKKQEIYRKVKSPKNKSGWDEDTQDRLSVMLNQQSKPTNKQKPELPGFWINNTKYLKKR